MGNDFFREEETKEPEQQQQTQDSGKIKLGDKEYDQDQLSELVGLGELAKKAEKKYNTKLDKVWPEYGKLKTKEKELEERLQELESQQQQAQPQPQQSFNQELNPVEVAQAKEAAKRIGIVTDDQFGPRLEQEFRKYYLQERAAEKLLETCEKLETEINGKDGRPAFEKETILNHMVQYGLRDPMKAYKDLYEDQLDAWKERKLGEIRRPGYITQEQPNAQKAPQNVKIDDSNLRAALEESLYGGVRE